MAPAERQPAFDPRRLAWAGGGFLLLALAIEARLVQLQILRHAEAARKVDAITEEKIPQPAPRGQITDRFGRPLAVAARAASVYADPTMTDPSLAPQIAAALGMEKAEVAGILARPGRFAWLKRGAGEKEWLTVARLASPGIGMVEETRRAYPQGALAGALLGRVGRDDEGLAGLEYARQSRLAGEGGLRVARRDARGRLVEWREAKPVREGRDLALTLDAALQFRAEQELERQVKASGAKGGLVAVMDPDRGDLLAAANWPPYDPENGGLPRDQVAELAYEPGSTFKAFTMIAALDAGKTRPGEVINCLNGSLTVSGQVIHDHKPFGRLTLEKVLAESSDVGVMQLGLRVGPAEFERYIRGFGFGAKTGAGLPGESAGILAPRAKWSGRTLPTLSMGQELSVSPLQLLAAYAAIANGGRLPRPRIALDDPEFSTPVPVKPQTLSAVARMLTGVVEDGTGKKASLPGVEVAGKTGTAQKAGRGGYLAGRYIASFIGFFPLDKPVAVVLVVIDEPKGPKFHGGDVAAPVFSALSRDIYIRSSLARESAPAPPAPGAADGVRVAQKNPPAPGAA